MPWNEDGSRKDPGLYKKSGFKMKGWSAFTKPDEEYTPQTVKPKDDITPQTQYPKVGETLVVKDSAEPTETGKIMTDDKEGSYKYNSETKTWTKTSDTGGKRSGE